jgi:nucleotide-binding universal stress UspA family protein
MDKPGSKKILIAVDFEEQSLLALAQGMEFAAMIGAGVVLMHVIEDTGLMGKSLPQAQLDGMKLEADNLLKKQLGAIPSIAKNVRTETLVVQGRPYEKIIEQAEVLHAAFIVIGCKGSGGLKRKFIGSNALHIVRSSHHPVITVKSKHTSGAQMNLVLPLDLTKETREKVARAVEFSGLFQATVRVLSVIFTKDEFIVNRLTRQLAQVKSKLEQDGVECSAEIVKAIKGEETLAQCIVDYAGKVDGDLLLLMTQQEMDSTEFFIGSSAQEIVLRSEMPVLSIIPGTEPVVVTVKNKKH